MVKYSHDMGGVIEMADDKDTVKTITAAKAAPKPKPLVTEGLAANVKACGKCASDVSGLKAGDMFPSLCRDHYRQVVKEILPRLWSAYEGD